LSWNQRSSNIAARHGHLVGAGTPLTIEEESNNYSALSAYHVQLNNPSPSAMLGLLQTSFPSGLLLPKTLRDAVLGQKCMHSKKMNRGRTPGRPMAAIPSVLSPGESQHVDIGFFKHRQGTMHSALIAVDRYCDVVEAGAMPTIGAPSAKGTLATYLDTL
jgi:hypothetical protein